MRCVPVRHSCGISHLSLNVGITFQLENKINPPIPFRYSSLLNTCTISFVQFAIANRYLIDWP